MFFGWPWHHSAIAGLNGEVGAIFEDIAENSLLNTYIGFRNF